MTQLSLLLLGPFHAGLNDEPITGFRTDKVRGLLAYLAVEADRPHRRDTLAALFWPDWADADALRNLRKSLHRLRGPLDRAVPKFSDRLLTVTRQTIQLNASALDLDVAVFRELLATVEDHPHRHLHLCRPCLDRLARAVDLYRGELLAGFSLRDALPFEEWLVILREQLHHQALIALHALADAYLRRGKYDLAGGYAAHQLAQEPWREEAHRQLMRALALGGKRAEALAQYEACRHILAEELGIAPSEEAQALYRQIAAGEGLLASKAATAVLLHGFPQYPTPFVGRADDLERVVECLIDPDCRLLTLVGLGGVGKTRLAVHAAEQVAGLRLGFGHGLFFVPLAGVESADLLITALGGSLGLAFQPGSTPRRQLLDYLQPRNSLLVLDNVEHLLVGPVIVELLAEILRAAPEVKLLVTSSEPLALQAEWLLPVGGLTYPGDDCQPVTASGGCEDCPHSAVQLFLQSAARSRVGFRPTAQDCATAIQICQMLEGLPLAIEIAATWVRAHDLATIAREVARSLDFLTSPLRDVPARHRSVRAIFDHTWDLLTPAERAALSQASVFRGGFHLAAANEILAVQAEGGAEQVPARFPIPNILVSLVNKSLLRCASDGRYEMHELLRQFAAEKLEGRGWSTGGAQATADEMHKRHGEYYLKLVDRWAADLDGERSHLARLAIQHDLDNIRQAWQWAIVYARSDLVEKARFDNPPPWMYDMA